MLHMPTMPSADSSHGIRDDSSSLSQFPWHATSHGTWEASRGQLSYRRCIDAGFIKHSPCVDGGLCGCVPARPGCTTPRIRFVSLAPHLRSTLPSDAPSRERPGASLVLRLHAHRRVEHPQLLALAVQITCNAQPVPARHQRLVMVLSSLASESVQQVGPNAHSHRPERAMRAPVRCTAKFGALALLWHSAKRSCEWPSAHPRRCA
jgi:hypothetical protein